MYYLFFFCRTEMMEVHLCTSALVKYARQRVCFYVDDETHCSFIIFQVANNSIALKQDDKSAIVRLEPGLQRTYL